MVTEKPRACRSLPSEAEIIPFPSEEVTPPVTKMYLGVDFFRIEEVCRLGPKKDQERYDLRRFTSSSTGYKGINFLGYSMGISWWSEEFILLRRFFLPFRQAGGRYAASEWPKPVRLTIFLIPTPWSPHRHRRSGKEGKSILFGKEQLSHLRLSVRSKDLTAL